MRKIRKKADKKEKRNKRYGDREIMWKTDKGRTEKKRKAKEGEKERKESGC